MDGVPPGRQLHIALSPVLQCYMQQLHVCRCFRVCWCRGVCGWGEGAVGSDSRQLHASSGLVCPMPGLIHCLVTSSTPSWNARRGRVSAGQQDGLGVTRGYTNCHRGQVTLSSLTLPLMRARWPCWRSASRPGPPAGCQSCRGSVRRRTG